MTTQQRDYLNLARRYDRGIIRDSLRKHRVLLLVCGLLLLTFCALAFTFERAWPFTPAGVTKRLHRHSSAIVEFGTFREVFFPRPGFVAEQVTLRPSSGTAPSATIKRLTFLSSYSGLIGSSKSIESVQAEGLVVRVITGDASRNLEFHKDVQQGQLRLNHLVADGSVLEVAKHDGDRPLRFAISRLRMDDLSERSVSKFDVALQNPLPTMQIAARGELGPWRGQIELMPVSGTFRVSNGDLASIPAIGGELSSSGEFKGAIGKIGVSGNADVAGFEVRQAKHPMPLHVQFNAEVNTKNAQVTLQSVFAQLASTDIRGSGVIRPGKQQSLDIANLVFTCDHGRVDDLLRLFVSSPRPSLSGPIRFRTAAGVEHGDKPFLKRVRLKGNFVINDAHFTSPVTQAKLNKLGESAQGDARNDDPPDHAVSLLSSDVDLKDGVASLSNAKFQVPGADATGGGTFSVLHNHVQLRGELRMAAQLSQATKGVKSFFLKVLDPIFKKRGAGAEVPVYVSGTTPDARFKVGLK